MTTPNTPANGGQILTDVRIIELMRPHLDKADGGFACDICPAEVIEAGRAIEADLRAALVAVSVDAPLSAEIEAEAKAFEATLPHVVMRWGSILYPWGWRYANDAVQEQFKAWCNRLAAPAPVSGMPDLASLQRYRIGFSGCLIGYRDGDIVQFADVERLLNPAKEPK